MKTNYKQKMFLFSSTNYIERPDLSTVDATISEELEFITAIHVQVCIFKNLSLEGFFFYADGREFLSRLFMIKGCVHTARESKLKY